MQTFASKKLSPASEANGPHHGRTEAGCRRMQLPGPFVRVRADLIELSWPASAAARPVGHTNDRRQVAFSGARRPAAELPARAPEAPGPLGRALSQVSLRLNLKA